MDYIYQELDPAQAQALEAALDKCPECKEKLEAFQRTRAAMRELDDLAPPTSISQLLLEEAARATPAEQLSFGERLRRLMRVFIMHPAIAAAATLVVVLGVSFVVYRKGLPPAHRTPTADSPLPASPPPAGAGGAPAAADRESKALAQQQAQKKQETPAGASGAATSTPSPDNAGVRAGAELAKQGDNNRNSDDLRAAGPVRKRALGIDKLGKAGAVGTVGGGKQSGYAIDGKRSSKLKGALVDKNKDNSGAASGADNAPSTITLRSERRARARKKAPANIIAARKPQLMPQRRLHRRTRRRAANVLDVGGGSSGVWGNRSRYRYQQPKAKPRSSAPRASDDADQLAAPAPVTATKTPQAPRGASASSSWQKKRNQAPAEAYKRTTRHAARRGARRRPVARSRGYAQPQQQRQAQQQQQQAQRRDGEKTRDESKKVKKKKERDVVSRLLAQGRAAVARGDCQTAFARFNEAMRQRASVIGSISYSLGDCYRRLLKSKRYRVMANRVSSARNPRQYRRARKRAPTRARPVKRAAPAKK